MCSEVLGFVGVIIMIVVIYVSWLCNCILYCPCLKYRCPCVLRRAEFSRFPSPTTSMDQLSDELLTEFLSPALVVSDELLCDASHISPFALAAHPVSDVLLVCKRWLRVGTPLLYEAVVVRSTTQAQVLQMALSRNPGFGRYTKRLRFEGPYAQCIAPAIQTLQHVYTLCFTLSVFGDDDISGLRLALQTFNPARVILTMARGKDHERRQNAIYELCVAIQTWSNLVSCARRACESALTAKPAEEFSLFEFVLQVRIHGRGRDNGGAGPTPDCRMCSHIGDLELACEAADAGQEAPVKQVYTTPRSARQREGPAALVTLRRLLRGDDFPPLLPGR